MNKLIAAFGSWYYVMKANTLLRATLGPRSIKSFLSSPRSTEHYLRLPLTLHPKSGFYDVARYYNCNEIPHIITDRN